MKWTQGRVPPIKNIMDRFQIQNRILQVNQSLITGYGTPATYWHNTSLLSNGQIVSSANTTSLVKCYCWNAQTAQPDRTHALCTGTGIIDVNGQGGGYQRYGYREHIFATPSVLTLSSTNIVKSPDLKTYSISGTSLTESLTTPRITLDNYLSFDYFLVNDKHDNVNNKVEYYYSLDDITWVPIDISATTHLQVATDQGTFTIPVLTPYIRFKITIRKHTSTASSGVWNSIRFRYKKMRNLSDIDPRFDINSPAFLAVRQQQKTVIEGGDSQSGGWVQRYPLQWRVLPDATIENTDVIKFLEGTYKDYMFEAKDVTKMSYGQLQQILHRDFESSYLRDNNDVMKVVHLLI